MNEALVPGAPLAASVFDLSAEVVLVTGASSGLGRRFAKVLAANGARVMLAGRRQVALDAVASEIVAAGGEAVSFAFELRDHARIADAFDAAEARFGPVTVVVNNAGVAGPGRLDDLDLERWREIIAIDLDAAFLICREAARRMAPRGTGNIINVSSILAIRPVAGEAVYSVAKAGLSHLSRILALELADRGIRVNALVPGYVVTGMNEAFFASDASRPLVDTIPMRRVGQVEDFDGAILLLASDASRFMTGASLVVDGGHTLAL